jgi:hypothetical protein
MNKRIIKLGSVGVDTGQLILVDPAYLDDQFIKDPDSEPYSDYAHTIYRHKDGTLWQYTNGKEAQEGVNKFPGSYQDEILQYGKTPNELINSGDFEKTDMEPTPHIPKGEFSYRGICKETLGPNKGGQLNYKMGHAGVAVAFSTGMGDGMYQVFAELVVDKEWGERVRKVWVEFF